MATGKKWSRAQAWAWYEARMPILGCNYLPATAVNATEMWQADTFDEDTIRKEMPLAKRCGMNSLRVFLPFTVWQSEPEAFCARMKRFLDILGEHGLSMMPILFDDCAFAGREPYLGAQAAPVPGVHNSGWTPSPGFLAAEDAAMQPALKAYVQGVIGAFAADERVLAWDLYNEPGNSGRGNKSLPLVENAFAWARECAPPQPLTACIWAWNNLSGAELAAVELSDIVSFHSYNRPEKTQGQIELLKGMGRPLLCTEWLHRPLGNTPASHLDLFAREQVGLYNWGLVNGRTQTHLEWATMKGRPDSNPDLWQHDLFHTDGAAYDEEEIALLHGYTEKRVLQLPPVEMTPAVMERLEGLGLILRLAPGRYDTQPGRGETLGHDVYVCSEEYGPHKMISVTVNRTELAGFGTHPDKEDFLLIGNADTEPMYLVLFLGKQDSLEQKRAGQTLAAEDFIALRVKYNDPAVSFFTMLANVPHGECCGTGGGRPGSFYVSEPSRLPLEKIGLGGYRLQVCPL